MDKERLTELFGSDEAIGVRISLEDGVSLSIAEYHALLPGLRPDGASVMPDGSSAVQCTNYAHHVRDALSVTGHQVEVVGFACEDNPTSRIARKDLAEGHDFAIVDGRYLVDPWIKLVECEDDQVVYDLDDPVDAVKATEIYGPRECWLPLESSDKIGDAIEMGIEMGVA